MIGRAGRYVGQQAIQLHGGMGMTDELNVSHYFKRLTAIDVLFGNAAYQRQRFATMEEDQPSAQIQAPRKSWVRSEDFTAKTQRRKGNARGRE